MIIGEDKSRSVILKDSEIEKIIDCLEREPHTLYVFFNHEEIIRKLKEDKLK